MRKMQPSFAAGELSPSLWARVDMAKYHVGCRTLRNMIVHPHGGASNRPGTKFVGEVPEKARLIPFEFSVTQTYMLVFTGLEMRVIKDGAFVLRPLTNAPYSWVTGVMGMSPGEYVLANNSNPGNDPMLPQPQDWEVFIDGQVAPRGTPGLLAQGEWGWAMSPGGYMAIYVRLPGDADPNAQSAGFVSCIAATVSPFAAADLPSIRYTQSFDTLFLTHPSYTPRSLTRTDHHLWSFATPAFAPETAAPAGVSVYPAAVTKNYEFFVSSIDAQTNGLANPKMTSTGGTDAYGTATFTPKDGTEQAKIDAIKVQVNGVPSPWDGTVQISWDNRAGAYWYTVFYREVGATNWSIRSSVQTTVKNMTGQGSEGGNSGLGTGVGSAAAPDNIRAMFIPTNMSTRTYGYKVSATVNGAETLPSTDVLAAVADPWTAGTVAVLTWTAVPGATRYDVYKNSLGQWGWIGSTEELRFVDNNIDPDVTFGPLTAPTFGLDTAGNMPGAVALFQQRLCYARSDNSPSTVWTSRTGALLDFSLSDPLREDDPVEARPASGRADEIRHMVPFDGLLIFTAGSEWIMRGSDGALKTTNLEFNVQSYYGSADVAPIVAGKSVLFLQRNGKIVRDFAYNLESDGYSGNDMTVMARHVTERYRIVDWAYALNPDGVVWSIREDGALLGFTYHKEHDVYAWHRHDTDGEFQSVAVLPGDDADEVYFCVKRTISNATKYYIERLAERIADGGVFLDCSLSYSGAAATTISGLGHLEGKTVTALADKNVVTNRVVTGGQITLPQAAEDVHVGLPYVSELETLDIDTNQADVGSNQGRRQKVSNVVVRLKDTRGLWAGPDLDNLFEVPFRTFEGYNEPTALFTGDKPISITPQWGRSAKISLRQTYPLPVTVLGVLPELEVGG